MALRDINLIAPDILAHRFTWRHLLLWSVCLLLCLALIFSYDIYQTQVVLAKKGAMSLLKDTQTQWGSKIEEIQRIQKELGNLSQQQTVLGTIKKSQAYSMILVKLADIMNEHTWLTQLAIETRVKEKENESYVQLTGFSFSNEELGDFLHRLASQPLFKRVILKYSREGDKKQSGPGTGEPERLIQFQIECDLKQG